MNETQRLEKSVRLLRLRIFFSSDSSDSQEKKYYKDSKYEYRHAIVPPELLSIDYTQIKNIQKKINSYELLTEGEWRGLGVVMSRGWQHYMYHKPEPHVLLFRRPLGTDPVTGKLDPELEREAALNLGF